MINTDFSLNDGVFSQLHVSRMHPYVLAIPHVFQMTAVTAVYATEQTAEKLNVRFFQAVRRAEATA